VSAPSSAAASGVVLGIVLVFLAQQFGWLALTGLFSSIFYFAIAVIVGGVAFGVPAKIAGRGTKPAPKGP
jgi:hypothetical protein